MHFLCDALRKAGDRTLTHEKVAVGCGVNMICSKRILVIGIGNDARGDDAVGLVVARRLKQLNLPCVTIRESSGDGTVFMETWNEFDVVALIDGFSFHGTPGSIVTIDLRERNIARELFPASAHQFGLVEAIELARVMNCLPGVMKFYGIRVQNTDHGTGLSRRVQSSAQELTSLLAKDLLALLVQTLRAESAAPSNHAKPIRP